MGAIVAPFLVAYFAVALVVLFSLGCTFFISGAILFILKLSIKKYPHPKILIFGIALLVIIGIMYVIYPIYLGFEVTDTILKEIH